MSLDEWPARLRADVARSELSQLIGVRHQLRRAGLDSAEVDLLVMRKRDEVNELIKRDGRTSIPATLDR